MAQQVNRLVARSLSSITKPGRHNDGNGLYLNVTGTGAKSWLFIYKYEKKRRSMGLGSLSTVSLADARERARELRNQLAEGSDPLRRDVGASPHADLFSEIAVELIASLKPGWRNAKHSSQWTSTLTTHAASLWDQPINAITTQDVLGVLSPIWSTIPETATRVRARVERVLDAAKVKGLRDGDNPARWRGHLEILLPKRKIASRAHHPAMPYELVPSFIGELRDRAALSARALEFTILTAARTSEVLKATWDEFDFKDKLWTIPAGRMKAGSIHRVPLTTRALAILEHVKFLDKDKPFAMSNMAMALLLRRMDCRQIRPSGFISNPTSACNRSEWN